MTIESWNAVAAIISAIITATAALASPSLAELVKRQLNQPKESPIVNQHKTFASRLKRLFFSFGFMYLFSISSMIYISVLLYLEIVKPDPVTRIGVFKISLGTAGIIYYCGVIFYFRLRQKLAKALFLIDRIPTKPLRTTRPKTRQKDLKP